MKLQQESFPILARYGNIWRPGKLKSSPDLSTRPFVAVEEVGTIVGSASTLIINLDSEYTEHTWKGITADDVFTNHSLTEIVYTEQMY